MKQIILLSTLIAGFCLNARAAEINLRNFVSLNRKVKILDVKVYYVGSNITNVCGLELRTNVPLFASSHSEAFLNEVAITERNSAIGELPVTIKPNAVEPFVIDLKAKEHPEVNPTFVTIRSKSGKSLKQLVKEAAEKHNLKPDGEAPEIILVAHHCPIQQG